MRQIPDGESRRDFIKQAALWQPQPWQAPINIVEMAIFPDPTHEAMHRG
jgi:hypothetical protein